MEEKDLRHQDKKWPSETHLVMAGNGTIDGLQLQRPMVRRVINGGIDGLHLAMMFIDAFPDSGLTTKFIRDAFLEAANKPGYEQILKRLKKDVIYLEKLENIVSHGIAAYVSFCC